MKWLSRIFAAVVVISLVVAGVMYWLGSRDGPQVASALPEGDAPARDA